LNVELETEHTFGFFVLFLFHFQLMFCASPVLMKFDSLEI